VVLVRLLFKYCFFGFCVFSSVMVCHGHLTFDTVFVVNRWCSLPIFNQKSLILVMFRRMTNSITSRKSIQKGVLVLYIVVNGRNSGDGI
jgi:hypothetical protein